MKTLSLTGLLLLVIMGMSTILNANSNFNYADGGGIVVVVSGLTEADIELYLEMPSNTKAQAVVSVFDSKGKLILQQSGDSFEIQFTNVVLRTGGYTVVVDIGGTIEATEFQI